MKEKIEIKQSDHNFVYSHTETINPIATTSSPKEYDVVVCNNCGKVKRFEKK